MKERVSSVKTRKNATKHSRKSSRKKVKVYRYRLGTKIAELGSPKAEELEVQPPKIATPLPAFQIEFNDGAIPSQPRQIQVTYDFGWGDGLSGEVEIDGHQIKLYNDLPLRDGLTDSI